MDLQPHGSYRHCIESECQNLPDAVLIGMYDINGYDQRIFTIEIMHCGKHLTEAQKFAKAKYPRVTFKDNINPPWLLRAQTTELLQQLERRKP